ncbi:MAG: hypothetical protein ACI9OD_004982, partial [Limisphaerales bacterium]
CLSKMDTASIFEEGRIWAKPPIPFGDQCSSEREQADFRRRATARSRSLLRFRAVTGDAFSIRRNRKNT